MGHSLANNEKKEFPTAVMLGPGCDSGQLEMRDFSLYVRLAGEKPFF